MLVSSLHHRQLARDDVVIAVAIRPAVRSNKLDADRVFAGRPAGQHELLVSVDPLHLLIVDDVTHAILATITFQLRIRQREVDHYRLAFTKSLAVWKIENQ